MAVILKECETFSRSLFSTRLPPQDAGCKARPGQRAAPRTPRRPRTRGAPRSRAPRPPAAASASLRPLLPLALQIHSADAPVAAPQSAGSSPTLPSCVVLTAGPAALRAARRASGPQGPPLPPVRGRLPATHGSDSAGSMSISGLSAFSDVISSAASPSGSSPRSPGHPRSGSIWNFRLCFCTDSLQPNTTALCLFSAVIVWPVPSCMCFLLSFHSVFLLKKILPFIKTQLKRYILCKVAISPWKEALCPAPRVCTPSVACTWPLTTMCLHCRRPLGWREMVACEALSLSCLHPRQPPQCSRSVETFE